MPASQAGRHEFDPRRPLQFLNKLKPFSTINFRTFLRPESLIKLAGRFALESEDGARMPRLRICLPLRWRHRRLLVESDEDVATCTHCPVDEYPDEADE